MIKLQQVKDRQIYVVLKDGEPVGYVWEAQGRWSGHTLKVIGDVTGVQTRREALADIMKDLEEVGEMDVLGEL